MSDNSSLEKKKYLKELITNQLKTVPPNRRLIYKDLARITKYIDSSIFDDDVCCIWDGYVTNAKNSKKGTYINFFFRNKKVALHRLLYENFIGDLGDDYYLKFSCKHEENKGKCCNVNHMLKYKYNSNPDEECKPNEVDERKTNAINTIDQNNTNNANTINKNNNGNKINKNNKNGENKESNLFIEFD